MTNVLVDIPETLCEQPALYTLVSSFTGGGAPPTLLRRLRGPAVGRFQSISWYPPLRKPSRLGCPRNLQAREGQAGPAAFYRQQLKPLQGRYVPQYYGYYEGTVCEEDEDVPVACILLHARGARG